LLDDNLAVSRFETFKARRHSNGATLLMALAYYNHTTFMNLDFMMDYKNELSEADQNGDTWLFYAVQGNCKNGIDWAENHPQINRTNKIGETALIRAAQFDRDYLVLLLLRNTANPDYIDQTGKSALFYSAEYDYFQTTLNLIIGRAETNVRNPEDLTPLMLASKLGNKKAVTAFLLAKKMALQAKLTAQKSKKQSDIILAKTLGKISLNTRNSRGETALSLARKNGHQEIVKLLAQK